MQLHPILGDVVFFFKQKTDGRWTRIQAMEQLSSNPEMLNQATEAMKNLSPEAAWGSRGEALRNGWIFVLVNLWSIYG